METKSRVLIADSGEDFRFLMAETISAEEDMTVVGTAGDGIETLALIEQKHPNVIIMDLVLTKLDGLGVLQKLSQSAQKPAVIIVSGFFINLFKDSAVCINRINYICSRLSFNKHCIMSLVQYRFCPSLYNKICFFRQTLRIISKFHLIYNLSFEQFAF